MKCAITNILFSLLFVNNIPQGAVAQDDDTVYILVKYENEAGKNATIEYDLDKNTTLEIEKFDLIAIEIPADQEETILEELNSRDDIVGAVGDLERNIPEPPSEPEICPPDEDDGRRLNGRELRESTEYGIKLVQADELFKISGEASGSVKVCIVDTGTEDGHEDLPTSSSNGMTGTDGYILTELAGTWDNDGNGHGTHCAGVIGAIGDNGKGVVGVRANPELFQFHIGKGLSDQGAGGSSNIFKALEGCYNEGAKVISMSLGGPISSGIENTVYKFLYDQGFLVVAAAGNAGDSTYSYPASYPTVLSVAAVDSKEKWATFSQFNDQVELAAPGVNIKSTYIGNTYAKLSGTSMACPHVAGIAAEVWSHFPDCTNEQIRNVLLRSAKDIGGKGYDAFFGYGIVQGKAAYDMLKADGCSAGDAPGGVGALSDSTPGGCQQLEGNDCENLCLNPEYANTAGGATVAFTTALISGFAILFLQFAF